MSHKIINSAKKTIEIELQELLNLKDRFNDDFVQIINRIIACKGKIVVTGIGKSAHIAAKFVATLNSTGTPAQFLHAAEAIHGDLGLLHSNDIVIGISNSGNSPEIKTLAPVLKNRASFLFGITGNKNSVLAQFSDYIIDSAITREACPINLAPTSSTIVQMAIGDAIAVALMEERGFKVEDFALSHPGGSLGKNLITTVENLVKNDLKPSVNVSDKVKEVILSLSSTPYGITIVLNENRIAGVITDGDLRRNLLTNNDINSSTAEKMMSTNPKTIDKSELASSALKIMKEFDIGQLVVLDKDKYYGIIEIHQLLEEGII